MKRVQCIHCGASVPLTATTCIQCGAPPPAAFFEPDEIPTWGDFSAALNRLSSWYREPPEALGVKTDWLIIRNTDRMTLQAGYTHLFYTYPRGSILTYFAVQSTVEVAGSFRMTVNASLYVVELPMVAFPISLNVMLDTNLVSHLQAEIEIPPSATDRHFDFFRRSLMYLGAPR